MSNCCRNEYSDRCCDCRQICTKDYIEINKELSKIKPCYQRPKMVVEISGHRVPVRESIVPKGYDGTVIPKYMKKRMAELAEAKRAYERECNPPVPRLTDCEKTELLRGLKIQWEKHQQELMSLPLRLNTESLKNNYQKIVRRLEELEKHIQMLERHNKIIIRPAKKRS
ncbi:hypothetical protein ACOME3_004977 [Neoechinorhynchus agilis]